MRFFFMQKIKMMAFMRQENISLRQNELKGALIDYDVNEITHD